MNLIVAVDSLTVPSQRWKPTKQPDAARCAALTISRNGL
jgi:hypothetical protein